MRENLRLRKQLEKMKKGHRFLKKRRHSLREKANRDLLFHTKT